MTLTASSSGSVVGDLGKPAVEELLLNWLAPFLTEDEKDRLIWHLGDSKSQLLVLDPQTNLTGRVDAGHQLVGDWRWCLHRRRPQRSQNHTSTYMKTKQISPKLSSFCNREKVE